MVLIYCWEFGLFLLKLRILNLSLAEPLQTGHLPIIMTTAAASLVPIRSSQILKENSVSFHLLYCECRILGTKPWSEVDYPEGLHFIRWFWDILTICSLSWLEQWA
jgi:hypothetical protein